MIALKAISKPKLLKKQYKKRKKSLNYSNFNKYNKSKKYRGGVHPPRA